MAKAEDGTTEDMESSDTCRFEFQSCTVKTEPIEEEEELHDAAVEMTPVAPNRSLVEVGHFGLGTVIGSDNVPVGTVLRNNPLSAGPWMALPVIKEDKVVGTLIQSTPAAVRAGPWIAVITPENLEPINDESILPTRKVKKEIVSTVLGRYEHRRVLARERQRRRRAKLKIEKEDPDSQLSSQCEKMESDDHSTPSSEHEEPVDIKSELKSEENSLESDPNSDSTSQHKQISSEASLEFEGFSVPKKPPHTVDEKPITVKSETLSPEMSPRSDDIESEDDTSEQISEEYILSTKTKDGDHLEKEPNFTLPDEASNYFADSDESDNYNDVPIDSLEPITIIEVSKKETDKKRYKCDFCPKSYLKKDHLDYHLPKHTGIKPFACDLCDKSYPRKENLLRHRALHISETPHICKICQQGFRYKNKLDDHRKANHPEDCFTCDVCNRMFSEERGMMLHKRTHITEFTCDICSKVYANRTGFLRHRMIHNNKPDRFPCDMCSSKFYCRQTMLRHRTRMHLSGPSAYPRIRRPRNPYKPFSCEICHKKLRNKFNLDYHRKTHFKKKPHTCKVCSITLPSRDDFVQHKLDFHPEERVFTCETCSMSFWHRELLVKHVAKHLVPLE